MKKQQFIPGLSSFDLDAVPEIVKPLLAENVSVRSFSAGKTISGPGEDDGQIRFILSGKAEVVVGYRAAHEVIMDYLEPGDVFGDLAFLTGREWPVDSELVALEACDILEIPIDRFQRVLRENPEFSVSLLKLLAKRMVRVDRSEFTSLAKVEKSNSTDVCAYPSYPGMPEAVLQRFRELAVTDESLIIVGENGVGREIVAYAVFEAAEAHKQVLVPIDVRKLGSGTFFLREGHQDANSDGGPTVEQMRFLFGEKVDDPAEGDKTIPGYLDLADKGTMFIRAADRLTAVTQQKLLDALKTGVYCPTGSTRVCKADFRLVCATDLDPSQYSREEQPLLHELKRNALVLPPLRERRHLIPALARHYLLHYAHELHKRVPALPEGTLKSLMDYSWPGNDLELANAMRRAVLVSPGDEVRRHDLTFDTRGGDRQSRYDLLQLRPIRQALLSPLYPTILQSAFVPIFFGVLLLLFLGPSDPSKNVASMVLWGLAWPGMVVAAFFGARTWCSICAIGALSKLGKRIAALEIPFPEPLKMRSDFLIAGGILAVIWIECATDIRGSPFNLGVLLLGMFLVALVCCTLFARQAYCRYMCPLGGMAGLLARTSLIELRADRSVCLSRCSSHECYHGTANSEGCPFGQVAATLHSNHFCKICASCLKNCPYGAIRLNLRMPGNELWEMRHVRTGTGFLVLGVMGGWLSDMLTRLPSYHELAAWVPGPGIVKFTVVFVGIIAGLNLLCMAAAAFSHRVYGERFFENYARFALALLPLTCMGFFAFHAYYLVELVAHLPALLSDSLNITAFGHSAIEVPRGVTLSAQYFLLGIGLAWTLVSMYRLGRSPARGRYPRRVGIVPHALVALICAGILTLVMRAAFSV